MKKKVFAISFSVLVLIGLLLTPESETTAMSKEQGDLKTRGDWRVKMVSNDRMDCYRGGQSDCPINWFLTKDKR